jgi:S-formylglutathione hydrolase FrmB
LNELIGKEDYEHIFLGCQERELSMSPLNMRIHNTDNLPNIFFDCGLNDGYIEMIRRFHQRLNALNVTHRYEEHPGGHTWFYWCKHLKEHCIFHNDIKMRV